MDIPAQKIPESKKTKEFSQQTIDALIDKALAISGNKSDLNKYYMAAAGILNEKDYDYFLNPYNTQVDRLKRFARKLRNYDIIGPIIKRYVGEYIKQSFDVIITTANADVVVKYQEELQTKVMGILEQQTINKMNERGLQTGVPSQPTPDVEQFVEDFKATWTDSRAILGQEAYNYFWQTLEMEIKYIEAFYHWIVADEVYTYRNVYMDQLVFEVEHPANCYPLYNNETFVEDMDGFVTIKAMTPNEIINKFRGRDLNVDKFLDKLEGDKSFGDTDNVGDTTLIGVDEVMDTASYTGSLDTFKLQSSINVYEVEYLGYRMIKILEYIDKTGIQRTMEVDSDYKLNKAAGDIKLTTDWVNYKYEGVRIGELNNAIYIHLQPAKVQRHELNNKSVVKLDHNGVIGMFKYGGNNSIVRELLPYQALYNIFHAGLEELINKNKHKMIVLPRGIIPNDKEMNTEEFFTIGKQDGVYIVDDSAEGFSTAVQAIKTLDANLGDIIKQMIELLSFVKNEGWEAVEMNRQRFGETYASDGKANTQEAIFRSSLGSVPMFKMFETLKIKDIQALLDYSKFAWIDADPNNSIGPYITPEKKTAFFSVNPKEYCELDFGVFAAINSDEADNVKFVKSQMVQPMLQNQQTVAISLLDAKNMAQIKQLVDKYEKLQQRAKELEATNAQKLEGIKAEKELNKVKLTNEALKYEADMLYQGTIDGKSMDIEKERMKIELGAAKDGDGDGRYNEDNNLTDSDIKLEKANKIIDNLKQKVIEAKKTNKQS